ncbi:MAG: hypothetical protein ACKVPX_11630 [Myxococcaceae bacterium]
MKTFAVGLLSALCLGAAPRPPAGQLRRAFEAAQAVLVDVESKRGRGLGVRVGPSGEVITTVDAITLEEASVKTASGASAARVLFAQAHLGVALIQADAAGDFRATAVRTKPIDADTWLVGIAQSRAKRARPSIGRVLKAPAAEAAFFETDLALPRGSIVFDAEGRFVGVVLSKSSRGARVTWVHAIREQLAATLSQSTL